MKLKFWIKERHNPQFDKPYYVAYGKMGNTAAKRKGDTMYGSNVMLSFESKEEYDSKLSQLRADGFRVEEQAK